jgi:Family of unknown function (DUF6205)
VSYSTGIDGQIDINPPLPWKQIKDSPLLPANNKKAGYSDALFNVTEETVHTDDGELTRRSADALVPNHYTETSGRTLLAEIQSVVDANPSHEFTGMFECSGERPGDLWRAVVRDGRAAKIEASIMWPEDGER